MTCVFCDLIDGQRFLYGDSWAVVLEPLEPHAPGHLLVVPIRHVADAGEDPVLTAHVMQLAAREARGLPACNILTSAGAAATQTVMHLHLHVVPRGPADGLPAGWPWKEADAVLRHVPVP